MHWLNAHRWRAGSGLAIAQFALILSLAFCGCQTESAKRGAPNAPDLAACELRDGGIIRGPTNRKCLALVFTAHEFDEGADTILRELARRHGHGSFFLTGAFLEAPRTAPLRNRLLAGGHYLGPHSDRHLLYCAWEAPRKTRVSRAEFRADLLGNVAKLPAPARPSRGGPRYFLPAYEHYNPEIAGWTAELGFTLINYTPGTRSNADYTSEAEANFVSSQAIFDSIVRREREDPRGLNGYILLLHLGSGPGRSDKFHRRFGELLDYLAAQGYQFVRVDELLKPPAIK